MDFAIAHPIARTILYEGYRLYPYRTSSLKNREPCAFGSLYPMSYSLVHAEIEPWSMQTECLVRGNEQTSMQGRVRFLRTGGTNRTDVRECEWVLPECTLFELVLRPSQVEFVSEESSGLLQAVARLSVERATPSIFKICVRIENRTPVEYADRSRIAAHLMLSTHALLGVSGGTFLSLIDPPGDASELAESCRNRGLWPVLIGNPATHDMILAAPIILYDYPQVAHESPGNLFDATEIDELLTLRILTLTDAEKNAMRSDDRTRSLLERTERMSDDQRSALHGAIRQMSIAGAPTLFEPGDRVRLRPQGRADILDLALSAQRATVVAVEQDFEGRVLVAVTVDGDPGHDLGVAGKPGHRFFFRPDEVERLDVDRDVGVVSRPRILVAGVGNIFRGDDAFGSELARRLEATPLSSWVRIVDFGIRGHDLSFALEDDYEDVILLDVTQRGAEPGTLSVIEPDLSDMDLNASEEVLDTHAMHPLRVLRLIQASGRKLPRLRLVSCEPLTFGPDEGHVGLSQPVEAAVSAAIPLVLSILDRMCADERRTGNDVGAHLV